MKSHHGLTEIKSFIVVVVGLGILARLTLIGLLVVQPLLFQFVTMGDAIGYMQLASNMTDSQIFRFDGSGPTAYRMVGYPLFLAVSNATHNGPIAVQLIQVLADGLTIFLTYLLALSVCRSILTSAIAAALVAFNPLLWISSVSLLPETLALLTVTASLLLLIRWPGSLPHACVAAIALGISIYLKPTLAAVTIIMLGIFAGKWVVQRRTLRHAYGAVLPLLVVSMLLAPWIIRNMLVMEHFIPLTTSNGSNLYGGNNSNANGGFVSDLPYVLNNMTEIESDRQFSKLAVDWIRTNPLQFLSLLPQKAIRLFWPLARGTGDFIRLPLYLHIPFLALVLCYYGLVMIGSLALAMRHAWWMLLMLVSPVLTLLLMSLLTFGAVRFLLPAYSALAVLAAVGFCAIMKPGYCSQISSTS